MDLIVFERLVGKDNMPGAIKRLQQRNTSVWTKAIAADDGHQKSCVPILQWHSIVYQNRGPLPFEQKHYPAGTSTSTNVRPDETEVHAVFNGLPYHCGFPHVRIVCQQIRGIPFECFSARPPASSSALGGLIHKLTNTL